MADINYARLVKEKEEEFAELYGRIDSDLLLFQLDPFIMRD